MPKKPIISFEADAKIKEALFAKAAEKDTSVSSIIRTAIRKHLRITK